MKFKTPLIMEHIVGERLWKLHEPFYYKDIVVPAGFVSDGASIPRLFYTLIGGPFLEYIEAAIIHDWMCVNPAIYSRKEADDTFLEIMTKLGVKEWRRDAMWRAVSLFQRGKITNVEINNTINDGGGISDT